MADNQSVIDVEDLKAANARELHRAVSEEGVAEMNRSTRALFWSGLAGGLAITASLIAEGSLASRLPPSDTRDLIIAFGYPIGFLIVVLGRMQLFTESTVTAMLPLVSKPSWSSSLRTLRLWGIVLGSNMTGTAITAALFAFVPIGDPGLRDGMLEVSAKIAEHGPVFTFVNAIPAGFFIAILAWTLPNARDQAFLVISAITYLLAIGGFSHSVVGSNETFLLLFAGKIDVVPAIFGFLLPAICGNLFGGAGLFAVLAHAQVSDEMAAERLPKPRRRAWAQTNSRKG